MTVDKRIGFVFLCIICMYGCFSSSDYKEPRSPKSVDYKVLEKSAVFNRKNMSFTIDSMENRLFIRLTINELAKDFPFPINKKFKDTLTKTIFNFDFYSGGELILSDYTAFRSTLRWDKKDRNAHLKLISDSVDLQCRPEISFEIPYYAFHQLKKGKKTIELHMWQELFTERVDIKTNDGSFKTSYLSATKRLFDAMVKFEIEIPSIYQSTIYGQGLVLKNDSTFSPSGMDHTIWKSSYPDIYWAVVYPKKTLYAQTPFETSTTQYVGLDTFTLYHYYENDSIGFDVYDHDNLSKDDFLGSWWGALNMKMFPDSNKVSFGNVAHFNFKVKKQGCVN